VRHPRGCRHPETTAPGRPAGLIQYIADLFGYFTDDSYVDHTPG
jgi:hypothetical protein